MKTTLHNPNNINPPKVQQELASDIWGEIFFRAGSNFMEAGAITCPISNQYPANSSKSSSSGESDACTLHSASNRYQASSSEPDDGRVSDNYALRTHNLGIALLTGPYINSTGELYFRFKNKNVFIGQNRGELYLLKFSNGSVLGVKVEGSLKKCFFEPHTNRIYAFPDPQSSRKHYFQDAAPNSGANNAIPDFPPSAVRHLPHSSHNPSAAIIPPAQHEVRLTIAAAAADSTPKVIAPRQYQLAGMIFRGPFLSAAGRGELVFTTFKQNYKIDVLGQLLYNHPAQPQILMSLQVHYKGSVTTCYYDRGCNQLYLSWPNTTFKHYLSGIDLPLEP